MLHSARTKSSDSRIAIASGRRFVTAILDIEQLQSTVVGLAQLAGAFKADCMFSPLAWASRMPSKVREGDSAVTLSTLAYAVTSSGGGESGADNGEAR